MFYRIARRSDLLTVDPFFASLDEINDQGDIKFTFTYKVDQIKMIEENLTTVNVSILTKFVNPKSITNGSHIGMLNAQTMILNILTRSQTLKKNNKEQELHVVVRKSSDISSRISNDVVTQLNQGETRESIVQFNQTQLHSVSVHDINDENENKPLLQFIDNTSSVSSSLRNDQDLMYRMITQQGIDPSYVTKLSHRSVSAKNSFEGVLRKTKTHENEIDPINQLANHYIFAQNSNPDQRTTSVVDDDSTMIQVASQQTNSEIEIPVELTIPGRFKGLITNGKLQFVVNFDLIDNKTNVVVQTVSKELDVSEHIKFFYTPKTPPVVSLSNVEMSTRTNIEVTQIDPGAKAVALYKKVISTLSVDNDDYKLVKTVDVTPGVTSVIQVDQPSTSTILYRLISVGKQGALSSEFTNIVLKTNRIVQDKSLSVVTRLVETGIEIEVGSFPPGVISIEVLGRNLSTFQKEFQNIGNVITMVSDEIKSLGSFSIIDTNTNYHNIYEYVAKLNFDSGIPEHSQSSILERIPLEPGKIDIVISDVKVTTDLEEPNVTFTMNSKLLDNELDIVRQLLEKQGIKEFFNSDLKLERDLVKDLLAYNVQRVNITTGLREDFGILVDDNFNDLELQKSNAIQPLVYGHRYEYEISVLLRSAETLFTTLQKVRTDPVTKKQYNFVPSKSLQPITLREGIIVSATGLDKSSKSAFAHGKIGFYETLNVSFDKPQIEITNFNAERFNQTTNQLTWSMTSDLLSQVDHFLIMKEVHGVRTFIGKAHSNFALGNVQYFHQLSTHDLGELKYVLVVVHNDYTVSTEFQSNSVIV